MERKIKEAQRAMKEGDFQEAISAWNKYLEREPEHAWAYHQRGVAKTYVGKHEAVTKEARLKKYKVALEDFNKAIEYDPEDEPALEARAEMRILTEKFELAQRDARKAKSLHRTTKHTAACLLLEFIPRILLEENIEAEEREYRRLCHEEFTTGWRFLVLDSWLVTGDVESDKRDKIMELVDLLREHQRD